MEAKKLGFGLMRLPLHNPNDATSIDLETTKKMVDVFLERGFTYFDTAWMYCGFKSEDAAKECLDKAPCKFYQDRGGPGQNFCGAAEKDGRYVFRLLSAP